MSDARRVFLRGALLLPVAAISIPAFAIPPQDDKATIEQKRGLRLYNVSTGEKLNVVYWKNGNYIDDHVGQLNYFMRDHRENKSILMDKNLYEFLHRLYKMLDTDERIHVLSAYRTRATNNLLRKQSKKVAKRSFHVNGRAIDFYIPGIDNKLLQREARRLMLGGVGYYSKSGFIHMDTGYPRHWVSA